MAKGPPGSVRHTDTITQEDFSPFPSLSPRVSEGWSTGRGRARSGPNPPTSPETDSPLHTRTSGPTSAVPGPPRLSGRTERARGQTPFAIFLAGPESMVMWVWVDRLLLPLLLRLAVRDGKVAFLLVFALDRPVHPHRSPGPSPLLLGSTPTPTPP